MDQLSVANNDLDEELWQEWVQKGRLQNQARRHRFRTIGGFITELLMLGILVYRLILRV